MFHVTVRVLDDGWPDNVISLVLSAKRIFVAGKFKLVYLSEKNSPSIPRP